MSRRPARQGLFHGWWLNLDGTRIRRIRQAEYGELYRLNAKHQDVQKWGRHTQAAGLGVQPVSYRGPWHDVA